MKYLDIEDVPIPVARFVMGTAFLTSENADAVFDFYCERGGNCFDTAHMYGFGGSVEKMLGAWIRDRGVRDTIVLGGKVGNNHTITPEELDRDIPVSLERLQVDCFDTFMMHRDNPEVPAGEFIDCLNRHRDAGRMRAIGVSNWTCERVAEANAYATENDRTGLTLSSVQFSLSIWNEPMWGECLAATDPDSRVFYEATQIAVLAWSSQANGFFTGRHDRDAPNDPEMVRTWYSDENWARYDRASELADTKGCTTNQVALAYVLHVKMKTFAIIGPVTVSETESSLKAGDVHLSDDDMTYLETGT